MRVDADNVQTKAVDLYNSASSSWSTAELSVPRSEVAATSVGNVAIFAGGFTWGGMLSNAVDLYNSASGSWSTAELRVPRRNLAATSVGNVAIFAGGNSATQEVLSAVELYNKSVANGVHSDVSSSSGTTNSTTPTAISVHPTSPFIGDSVTVIGHNFMLPENKFNCSAKIGPIPAAGTSTECHVLSSSRALVVLPHNILIAPSFVELHFEPGNFTTTARTRLCPCARSSGGTACGCALTLDACSPYINVTVPVTNVTA
jgi:hypothetical protein